MLPDPAPTSAPTSSAPSWRTGSAPLVARANALRGIYEEVRDNDLAEVYAKMQRDAFAVSDRLAALIKATPGQPARWRRSTRPSRR